MWLMTVFSSAQEGDRTVFPAAEPGALCGPSHESHSDGSADGVHAARHVRRHLHENVSISVSRH